MSKNILSENVTVVLIVFLSFFFFLLTTPSAQSSSLPPQYGAYYTIDAITEDASSRDYSKFITPLEILTESFAQVIPRAAELSLLQWTKHSGDPEAPSEPYNRKNHFGTWVNDPTDTTCFNTRAKTLIRDSEDEVTFKEKNHCSVKSGKWIDPYTGTLKTSTADIQIDHVVPLKHAYLSGAAQWSPMKRCLYANFLGNKFHLLAVDGHENMKKGDRAPDRYLPPNNQYVCNYLENWLRIKLIWNMTLNPVEAAAIDEAFQRYDCQTTQSTMTEADLRNQRAKTIELQDICRKHSQNI